MNINKVLSGKSIALGALSIIILFLISGGASMLPFVLFIGIIMGLIKRESIQESALAGCIASLIGAVCVCIFAIAYTYIIYNGIYGMDYLSYMILNYVYSGVYFIIVGTVGAVIGNFISKELKLN